MQRRVLGTTGCEISIIGFGGIVVTQTEQAAADALVAEAVDRGINYFDVAPSYGNAEERLGPALEPYRDGVFLACKTTQRDAAGARAELERSLRRLHTDYFDLYQLHGVTKMEEAQTILGPGGALETFVKARGEGLIRHIGFSAHLDAAAVALMNAFPFVSALFPLNYVTWHQGNFGKRIVSTAQSKGTARLALKAMARARIPAGGERTHPKCWYQPVTDPHEAELAVRWTLSQPITAAIPPGEASLFRLAMDIGERFRPLTEEEQAEVKRLSEGLEPIFRLAA